MQESRQSQPENPRGVSDLLDDEVRVCDTCGDAGREELLALCDKCTDGAAHIYCMRVILDKVPECGWTCEECMLRIDTEKALQDKVEEAPAISKGYQECQKSSSSSKLKFRSSSAERSRKNGVSSMSQISAKRHAASVEAQSGKRPRVVGMSAVSPRLSLKSSNSSSPCADISGKNLRKGKMKSAKGKGVTSVLQSSSDPQEKAKARHACGDKRDVGFLEAELKKKSIDLETRDVSFKTSKSGKSKLLEKKKLEVTDSVTSVKQSSLGTQEKAESSSILGGKSPKWGSKSGISQDKCPLLTSRSSKAVDLKLKGQLAKGSCLQMQKVATNGAYDSCKKGKDSRMVSKSLSLNNVSSNKLNAIDLEVFLESVSRTDALNELSYAKETTNRKAADSEVHLASASCPVALKKLSCAKETKTDKRNETSGLHIPVASDSGVVSVQGEKETECGDKTSLSGSMCHTAATSFEKDKLCTDLARDEISLGTDLVPYEAAIPSQSCIIPKPDYIWLGQFLILSSERLANYCDGIQAHLSNCASPKVLEVVNKFPKMITLDELPRLGMWPSQFVESQATEENIALYFFAEDLHSYRTYYIRLLDHMTKNDLALKGNLDGIELLIFPSSVLPKNSQRWNQLLFLWGVFRGRKQENGDSERKKTLDLSACINNDVGEVHEIDNTGVQFIEETIILNENGCSSGLSDPRQAVEERENRSESEIADLNLSLWPKIATPIDGIVENNADADNGEPSGSSFEWQNLNLLEREAVEILVSLKYSTQKISF